MSKYTPPTKHGFLIRGQAVKITSGKYSGHEGVVLEDKSGRYYKINITPKKPTMEVVEVHESDFMAIERLSMFPSIVAI